MNQHRQSTADNWKNHFCDLVDNFLQQFITGPTHTRGNTLDLLLCNSAESILDVTASHPSKSNFPTDHYIINFQIQQSFRRAKAVQRTIYDYNSGDFVKLRSYLLANTLEHFQSEDVNRCWAEWRDWFFKAVDQFIPTRTIKDVNSPPWIDGEVRHLIRKKYSAIRKYRQCRSEHRRSKLRELSQAVKNLIKTKHCQYLHKIKHSFCYNSKLFWSYHKAILPSPVNSKPYNFPQRHSCNNTPSEKPSSSTHISLLSSKPQHQNSPQF